MDIGVPPYPNLPATKSINTVEFLNSGVYSQHLNTTRAERSTIKTKQINTIRPYDQPRGYTMSDIANIDRRLQAVEYQVALNTLEANLATLQIPSSLDPTVNRFKFGYWADDFSTTNFSDLTDPQYSATKEGTDVVPNKLMWDVPLLNAFGSLPYIEQTIISQENATTGSLLDPTSKPTCGLQYGNTVAYATIFRNWTDGVGGYNPNSNNSIDVYDVEFADLSHVEEYYQSAIGSNLNSIFLSSNTTTANTTTNNEIIFTGINGAVDGGVSGNRTWVFGGHLGNGSGYNPGTINLHSLLVYSKKAGELVGYNSTTAARFETKQSDVSGVGDLWEYYPSAEAPPVVLYFYCYDQPTLIEIYQGNTLIVSTSSAETLTSEEQLLLTGSGASSWFNDQTNLYMKPFVNTGSGYVTYAGKLTFNYDWNAGNKFTIRTLSKTSNRMFSPWRWVMSYPINGSSVGCTPPPADWDLIVWHCTNGWDQASAVAPHPNTAYAITTSTANYDINTLWSSGNNAVVASGIETTDKQQTNLIQTKIIWGH